MSLSLLDYDWALNSGNTEQLSSNNVSPKSAGEQNEQHTVQKSSEEDRKVEKPNRNDTDLRLISSEEGISVSSPEPNNEEPSKTNVLETAVRKISLIDNIPAASVPASESLIEQVFPKPPPIDTSLGRQTTEACSCEKFEE